MVKKIKYPQLENPYENDEYWEERIARHLWNSYNTLEEQNMALLKYYEKLDKDVRAQILELVAKENDGLTRTEKYWKTHLESIQKQITQACKELGEKIESKSIKNMTAEMQNTYDHVMEQLEIADFDKLNKNLCKEIINNPWHGSFFSERLWKDTGKLTNELNTILAVGITQGKTVTEMAIQLSNRIHTSMNNAHRLVRTETINALNNATLRGYMDAGIEYIRWCAAEDERTCPTCGANHGRVYPIKDEVNLPCHPGCRCTWLPVFEDEIEPSKITNSSYQEAKTIEEAEEYANKYFKKEFMDKTFNGKAVYKGISVENANEINKALANIYDNYDFEKISGIKVISPTSAQGKKAFQHGADAMASYDPIQHGIYINKNVLKDAKSFNKYIKESEDAWETVMSNLDKLPASQKEKALLYKKAGRDLVDGTSIQGVITHEVGHHVQWSVLDTKTNNLIGSKLSQYAPKISGYANATKGEYIAESFVAYMKGEKSILDSDFVDFLDNKMFNKTLKDGIINVEIDELTPCLKRVKDGKIVDTYFKTGTPSKSLLKDWEFDWSEEKKKGYTVKQLFAKDDDRLQGLIATKSRPDIIAVEVDIVESSPFNNPHNEKFIEKEYEGVGAHLFAEAVRESYEQGFDGFVVFKAKTNLIDYYSKTLGARLINAKERTMCIDERSAKRLYEKYYK